MTKLWQLGILLFVGSAAFGCTIADGDRCGDDLVFVDGGCIAIGGGDTDTADLDGGPTDGDAGLGTACSCEGDGCTEQGLPVPTGGTIIGCAGVEQPWPAAELACMRTNATGIGDPSYFANGYCTLMALRCVGDELICGSAAVGDFEAMTSCPADSALIRTSGHIEVMGISADLDSALCAPLCTSDEDCRPGEVDPLLEGAPAGYVCHQLDGVRFCYDPRNLSAGATAEEM